MKRLFTLIFLTMATAVFAQDQPFLLVGAYTGGQSKGISVYRFNTTNGAATYVSTANTENPSYLAIAPGQQYVYAVNELGAAKGGGKVSAFRFDPATGTLTFINQQSSGGNDPCYITVDKTGRWVIAGNYSSGSLSVLPVQENGGLGAPKMVVQHKGSSVHERQKGPHVHATVLSPDNRFLYVPDLGLDKVMIYAFDAEQGTLLPADSATLPGGSGPRHLIFHPNGRWVYLIQEISGNVTVFANRAGKLLPLQTINSLPEGFSKPFTGADIHISHTGKFLYTSTRDEANELSIFRIDPDSGRLTRAGQQPVLGKTPRNFSIDSGDNFLLAANQNSDQIVVFRMNAATGALSDTNIRINVGNPVCLKWIFP